MFAPNYNSPRHLDKVQGSNGNTGRKLSLQVWDEGVGEYKVIRELVGLVTSLQPRAPTSTLIT